MNKNKFFTYKEGTVSNVVDLSKVGYISKDLGSDLDFTNGCISDKETYEEFLSAYCSYNEIDMDWLKKELGMIEEIEGSD